MGGGGCIEEEEEGGGCFKEKPALSGCLRKEVNGMYYVEVLVHDNIRN